MTEAREVNRISPDWAFVRWAGLFGVAIQGFWLLTSIYIVVEVGLSPSQLLLLGVALEVSILVAEVPTGVVADTISRKWSMVIAMLIMGAAFIGAGLSASFVPLVAANVAWGIGWTFASGADVAWINDELQHRGADRASIERVLTTKARWQQRGGAAGLVVFGLLGQVIGLSTAMVGAGVLMLGLAVWIGALFSELGFNRTERQRFGASIEILRSGMSVVRGDQVIVRLLLITLVFNLGAEAMDRLTETRILDLGLPGRASPVVFFTVLGIVGLLAGAGLLRLVEARIATDDGPRQLYAGMSLLAALGAVLVTVAPGALVGAAGVFLARGLAWSVLPVAGSIWINRVTTGETRATVQSILGQATSAGQILGGLMLGIVAAAAGLTAALALSAALFAASGIGILRSKGSAATADQPENS